MPVTAVRSRRYKEASKSAKPDVVSMEDGLAMLKSFKPTKFDQSVELIVHLGIDPKHADQMIRGSISLPHGIGKSKRVIAFCGEEKADEALKAGAVRAGSQDLVNAIEKEGFLEFDVAVASPDQMRFVGRLGKVLGPKGLMPSPKAGTVTPNVAEAVREYAAGKIEFRNDSGGNIHAVVGKLSFDTQMLQDNIDAMLTQIRRMKPQAAKGHYIKKVVIKSTMSPAVYLNITS